MPKRQKLVEISITPNLSLASALTWYGENYDAECSKAWAIGWLESRDPELVKELSSVPAVRFSNRGFVARLHSRGFAFGSDMEAKLIQFFKDLTKFQPKPSATAAKTTKPKAPTYAAVLEVIDLNMDAITQDTELAEVHIPVKTNELAQLRGHCNAQVAELMEDMAKIEAKIAHLNQVLEDAGGVAVKIKESRKTQKQFKPTNKAQAIRNKSRANDMKHAAKDGTTKGMLPSEVIDKKQAMVLHLKWGYITVYVALPGTKLGVQGNKFTNVDENRSTRKTLKQYGQIVNASDPFAAFNQLNRKPQPLSNRMSDDQLIAAVR